MSGSTSPVATGRTARYDRRGPAPPVVSVIVPTYNEAENLPILLERLGEVLVDFNYEIVVVDDDSPDRTWEVAERWAATSNRIRLLRRTGRRGLSSAVLDGMALAEGRVLAVIDADGQHDEEVLADLVSPVLDGDADICLGSRDAPGGSYGPFGSRRRLLSWAGTQLAHGLLGVAVTDPMSGFFAVSRQRFEEVRTHVNPRGFKILLELLVRGSRPRVTEVAYCFRARTRGETKLSGSVAVAYVAAIIELVFGRLASVAFLPYATVAVTGISLRLTLQAAATFLPAPAVAQILAFELATGAEFVVQNRYTFAPVAHRGWRQLGPLLRFSLVAVHSLLVQAGTATVVEDQLAAGAGPPSGLGLLVAAAVGVSVAVIGSFGLNITLTWPYWTRRGVDAPWG